MQIIPLRINQKQYSLYVLLEEDNFQRMREHDPAGIHMDNIPSEWRNKGLELYDVILCYCTPADIEAVNRLCSEGRIVDALQHVCRGYRWRPDKGDSDDPYRSLKDPLQ